MYMNIINKTDKYFFISLIILIAALVVPVTLVFTLVSLSVDFKFEIPVIPEILFVLSAINYIFIVPILIITQIITFIIKIFSKNKNTKDWIIILLNFFTMLFFGFNYLVLYLMVLTL